MLQRLGCRWGGRRRAGMGGRAAGEERVVVQGGRGQEGGGLGAKGVHEPRLHTHTHTHSWCVRQGEIIVWRLQGKGRSCRCRHTKFIF